ncbi:right-handed parallel beta-helix repeat-containing protein [Pedobacter jamesrossensis]|uniref:Right-handed parallel beta-helix repeat-containing protein n=1 Tax=Pedobacter jamesrossensis TaxID=1908238 RepID=A0ABV8NJC7_9SPHI
MKIIKISLIAVLVFVSQYVMSEEYFVSSFGNDKYPGTKMKPFGSIFKASEIARPADTVTILEGTYYLTKQFRPSHSGLPHKWILYRAAPNESVIFDGSRLKKVVQGTDSVQFSRLTEGLFQIQQVNYLRFENIEVRNSDAAGFIVRGPECKKIELVACKSDQTHNSGIGLWYCDSVLVKNCEIIRANDNGDQYYEKGQEKWGEAPHEALSICGASYFEVTGNYVHHCFKEGIDCKEVSKHGAIYNNLVHDLPRQAYYVDAWFGLLEDVEIHSNTAYNCMWGFGVSVEGKSSDLRNIRFHHNLIYNMKGAGVLFSMWGDNLVRSDIHIYNNTFYHCGSPNVFSGGVGSIDILSKNFRDIYIYRNICDKGWDFEMGFTFKPIEVKRALDDRNFVAAENLFEGVKNRPSRIGQFDVMVYEYLPPGNQIGSPLYRDELRNDFVPEHIPAVNVSGIKWKYKPSPWFGAFEPMK